MKKSFILSLLALALGLAPARAQRDVPADVARLTDSLRRVYAPDRRTALLDVDYTFSGRNAMLRGAVTSPAAKAALIQELESRGYRLMDCLRTLPDTAQLGDETYGILNLSVANLRVQPDFSAEMTTQGLLGMPVRVLERDGWYRIQTPDQYIAWVHPTGVHRVTKSGLEAWNRAPKVVVTAHYGFVYSRPSESSQPVSDVVAGNRLRLEGRKGAFYLVSYPDGRRGYLRRTLGMEETRWRAQLRQDAGSIIRTAHTLMGIPYLWAGTSSKGVDCSGFVRTVLFLHDILIPRDASQQAYVGRHIDIAPDFSNLRPGDLVFFGQKATAEHKERVVHVGIYIGDRRFIHSQGDVHVSSFDPSDPLFDQYNLGRLLFATRFLPYIGQEPSLNTTATNAFYH